MYEDGAADPRVGAAAEAKAYVGDCIHALGHAAARHDEGGAGGDEREGAQEGGGSLHGYTHRGHLLN